MSKKSIWLLPFVLVMLLGLAPELSEYRAINPLTSLRRGGVLRLLVVVLLAGAPLIVLTLGLLRLTRWRMRSTPATLWIFGILSYGIVASVVLASAAGLGSANAIVHGFALTFAVTGMVAFMVQAPMHYWGGNLSLVMLTLATGVALYSLAGVPSSIWQTVKLAEGQPYCLAGGPRNNDPLRTIPSLRNISLDFNLRRMVTGDVDLYPNHILIVQSPEVREYYYWSASAREFIPVTPDYPANGLLVRACEPQEDFLKTLRLY